MKFQKLFSSVIISKKLLKHYFQLFRISNIFTVPPDILAGYFVTTINNLTLVNYQNILILVFSSIFLYIGGLITNDLFDIKIDKIERPNRPLVSGNIKESTIILLSILFFGTGIFLAFLLTFATVVISIVLVIMILLYNYRLKNGKLRPFLMGGIRALNVIYGSTTTYIFFTTTNYDFFETSFINTTTTNLLIVSFAIFFHIFTLTLLSKRETENENKQYKNSLNLKNIFIVYLIIFIIILFIGITFVPNKYPFLVFFIAFLLSITIIFYNKINNRKKYGYRDIKFLVKYMIILLILLDTSFVAGSNGIYMGLLSISMIFPCLIIGKKVHMT
jgi:4-hydroxybenzoate polyprenyltransferase